MFLTEEEIKTLTGYSHASTQSRWLAERGLPHRLETRRIVLLRQDVEKWVHGEPVVTHGGINWAAVT